MKQKLTDEELKSLQEGKDSQFDFKSPGGLKKPETDPLFAPRVGRHIPIELMEDKVKIAKKYPFKSWYNSIPESGKVFTKPSVTVPDQTLSIEQLLNRHVRGLPLPGGRTPVFFGDDNEGITEEEFARMELTDRMDLVESQRELVKQLQKDLAEKEAKNKADFEAYQKAQKEAADLDSFKSKLKQKEEKTDEKPKS